MIIGIGTDLVDIRRIEKILSRYGARFEQRCFTAAERKKAEKRQDKPAFYAKRFAAKEACVKALGTGFIDNITLQDIDITQDTHGCPTLVFTGGALEKLNRRVPERMHPILHLSLSDEPPYAQAFVILEAYTR